MTATEKIESALARYQKERGRKPAFMAWPKDVYDEIMEGLHMVPMKKGRGLPTYKGVKLVVSPKELEVRCLP